MQPIDLYLALGAFAVAAAGVCLDMLQRRAMRRRCAAHLDAHLG